MVSKKSRTVVRENKHRKLRNRFSGTAERPRLAVFIKAMMNGSLMERRIVTL